MDITALEVLILFNRPGEAAGARGGRWKESAAGVLDEVESVSAALGELGVRHRAAGAWDLEELRGVLAGSPERIVFNLIEELAGKPGAANYVPAICWSWGKSTTGNAVVVLDKWQTKAALENARVPTPPAVVVPVGEASAPGDVPSGPLIVKPVRADASEGIDVRSVVPGPGPDLDDAVRRVHEGFGQPALVEQFIDGREINVALMERGAKPQVLPPAEIDFSAFPPERPRVVDYDAKWLVGSFAYRNTPRRIPAPLAPAVARTVARLARRAWYAVPCRDYARVDCRLDAGGRVWVLEVNPNPDISPGAGFPAALDAAGIGYADFVRTLLENAARRLPGGAGGLPAPGAGLEIRRTVPVDQAPILEILAGTGLFRPSEIEVARDVLTAALRGGTTGHYQSYTAVLEGIPVGWTCFGPTPGAQGTFDLYWIAVDPATQGHGIGRAMIFHSEAQVAGRGGRLIVAETSGRASYEPTRRFYERCGYRTEACLRDYYAPGDDKVVFVKRLGAG